MIQFHSTSRSERLDYVLNYVFKQRFGVEYTFVSNLNQLDPNQPIIEYNLNSEIKGIHIKPEGLLFANDFSYSIEENSMLFPYSLDYTEAQYPDIFSSIFYHISRYEEYNAPKDTLGRFDYKSSCLYQHKLIENPLVDEWLSKFKSFLIGHHNFKPSDFKQESFQPQASIDIDSVFSYKGRSPFRTFAAFSKDILSLNFYEILKRAKVLLNLENDPNDNFELQNKLLNQKKAWYFIQVGNYGKLDKNVSPKNKAFQKIIISLKKDGHQIGLHPSFASNGIPENIELEKKTLENILKSNLGNSRQHYLKLEWPKTYQALIAIGMAHDYTMGYSEIGGFRAGTAFPFYWYDLEKEKATNLLVHPFVVMDVAYKNFQKMTVEDAIIASGKLKDTCKRLNAPFVFVFHNESLSNHRGWENWDKVFSFWNND